MNIGMRFIYYKSKITILIKVIILYLFVALQNMQNEFLMQKEQIN
jgi:hypothetical protein